MKTTPPIYLDYAATTPIDPQVLEAMMPYFIDNFGNASSMDHQYGEIAKKAVEDSREKVASLINAEPKEIIFTSGATEAINIGLIGYYFANRDKGNHIITAATEHKAVLETCSYLESIGAKLTILPVDSDGLINLDELRNSINKDTIMVSIMYVNNETGVIQDIEGIGNICNDQKIIFFCDASQAAGKMEIDVIQLQVDMMVISGHKFYGPKGIGVLFKRKSVLVNQLIYGGGQEFGIRPGTYNTTNIVGLGKACELALNNLKYNYDKIKKLGEAFLKNILVENRIKINGSDDHKSPYILNLLFRDISSDEIILRFRNHFSVSKGSACNDEIVTSSYVLRSMGLSEKQANNSIRISFGMNITDKKLGIVAKLLINA